MNSSPYGSSALPDDRPPATGPVLDPAVLKDLQRLQPHNGIAFVNRLLRLYRDTLDKHQQALSAAWAAQHFRVIQDSAHALKSASANIGARELAEVCQVLEQALRHERWDEASRWVTPCLDSLRRTTEAVDALLGRPV